MVYVISAVYRRDYVVNVTFNDGVCSDLDLRATITGDSRAIVRELLNMDVFSKVTVDADTLVWPNGFDLAPEYLHDLALTLQTA
jgi:hypothetical protein